MNKQFEFRSLVLEDHSREKINRKIKEEKPHNYIPIDTITSSSKGIHIQRLLTRKKEKTGDSVGVGTGDSFLLLRLTPTPTTS